jgi:pilus assembly protein Flp/PilA
VQKVALLNCLRGALRYYVRNEKGATAVEYGIMVALIAAVIIASVTIVGTQLIVIFNKVITALGGTPPT